MLSVKEGYPIGKDKLLLQREYWYAFYSKIVLRFRFILL